MPSLAFLPAGILAVHLALGIDESALLKPAIFYHAPGFGLGALAKSFWGTQAGSVMSIVGGLAWATLIAYVLNEVARLITADDFSWPDFLVGFIIGTIPGALLGWRLIWIRFYKFINLPTSLIVGGAIGGVLLGIYMGACWSRKFR